MIALAGLPDAMAPVLPYVGIVLAVVLQGFFSGSETGAYRVNRVRLRLAEQQGLGGARQLGRLLSDVRGLICVTLIGTNITAYLATMLTTRLWQAGGASSFTAEMMATLALTPVLFVFAEVLPKTLYNTEADRLMLLSARPLMALRRFFGLVGLVPLLKGVSAAWNGLSRRKKGVGGAGSGDPFPARARLRSILRDSAAEGVVTPYQNELVEAIMALRDVHVGDAMVGVRRVVTLPRSAGLDAFLDRVRRSPYSRMPVLEASGQVAGVLHVQDVLADMAPGQSPSPMDFVRPAVILSPKMGVTQAIFALQRNRVSMAVVHSSEGRFIGIVTLKDLVEEIVGELEAW